MIKTIEEWAEEVEIANQEAEFWLEARATADRERHICHLKFIQSARRVDAAKAALIAAQGEPS